MPSKSDPKNDDYIFAERSPAEVERLNFQHNFILKSMGGNLFHPSISTEEIASIADIGCGTGIWLEDVSKALSAATPTGVERSYIGFDINPQMFPPESERGKIKFKVLDLLEPIPEEYRAKFDLVSLRILGVAIKGVDLSRAFRNAEQMITIEPGGYLQWADLGPDYLPNTPQYPQMYDFCQVKFQNYLDGAGYARDPPKALIAEAPASLKETLIHYEYPWAKDPAMAVHAAKFFDLSFAIMIPVILFKVGEVASLEEGKEKVQEMFDSVKDVPKVEFFRSAKWALLVAQKQAS